MHSIIDNLDEKFFSLFKSRPTVIGRYKNDLAYTDKKEFGLYDISRHLSGEAPIGLCPVLTDNTCQWGALDIDAHSPGDYVSLDRLHTTIIDHGLPFIICQSKRKGAHLYLFLEDPISASAMISRLKQYQEVLGLKCEIFPKQSKIGENECGNWLNLPYFGDTRKCWSNGSFISLGEFLDLADKTKKQTSFNFSSCISEMDEIKEAPPCIVSMCQNGIDEGYRNDAMYNFVVFARRAFPDNYRDIALLFNDQCFTTPLSSSEAKTAIKSASRRDYKYKCSQEPCRSRCKSAICVTKKYGITPDKIGLNSDGTSIFSKLRRINTSPITWELVVNDRPVRMSSEVLHDYKRLRVHILEQLGRPVGALKAEAWDSILSSLAESVEIVDVPFIASPQGILFEKLKEFISGVVVSDNLEKCENAIASGHGAVINLNGKRVAAFKGSSFMEWLKRRKLDIMKPGEMWVALASAGVEHGVYKGHNFQVEIWYCEPPEITKRERFLEAEDF